MANDDDDDGGACADSFRCSVDFSAVGFCWQSHRRAHTLTDCRGAGRSIPMQCHPSLKVAFSAGDGIAGPADAR